MSDDLELIKQFDADAVRFIGKSILDCTADDLRRLVQALENDAATLTASADQAAMVLREARACGCDTIAVLEGDISRAEVVHTCGGLA